MATSRSDGRLAAASPADAAPADAAPADAAREEAAAIVAAVERFLRDTAPASLPPAPAPALSAWKRAALEEGVTRRPDRI